YILIFIAIIISAADIGLYNSWGSKINFRAIESFTNLEEALGIIFSKENLNLFCIILIQSVFWLMLFKYLIKTDVYLEKNKIKRILLNILLPMALFIGIRGGFQEYPIYKNSAYFSENAVLNNSAINGTWNFFSLLKKKKSKINQYNFMSIDKSKTIFRKINSELKDSTEYILTNNKPNIVLIILESFSSEAIGCLSEEKNVTPGIDSLSKNGILFTNFYSTGFRTDQGLVALLSGFPAQPQNTIIKDFGKYDKLPSLIKVLKDNNYNTSYYYGGRLYFANTESYLKTSGINKLIGENDFTFRNKTFWGAYDKDLFNFHLTDCKNNKQPFFSIIMTSTSHEFFDGDFEKPFGTTTEKNKFKNALHYTDKCLFDYLNQAKSQAWFNNTLFVITADHAHYLPNKRMKYDYERHKIPFLLYGNVLKPEHKGTKNDKISSHIDFASTILAQLNISKKKFIYSKNIFNKYSPSFAFYTYDNGFGYISEEQIVVFDCDLNKVLFSKNKLSTDKEKEFIEKGKAYLETYMQEYYSFQ
ncbi:MAG: LTA synthase family protein, partial [Bacteroidetes bacterium]|nr:LTA synthase family protein [Bacteroidota bacterium]